MGVWSDRARRCANCEESIPARSRFCPECGMAPMTTAKGGLGSQVLFGAMVVGVMVIALVFAQRLHPGHLFLGHFG